MLYAVHIITLVLSADGFATPTPEELLLWKKNKEVENRQLEIVRGAGNATDLEAGIWGNALTCVTDEMPSLSFVSEECGWTPGQDLVDDFLGAAADLGIDIEVSNDALKGIAAFYSFRKLSHSYRDGAFTFVPCCKCASESFFRGVQIYPKST